MGNKFSRIKTKRPSATKPLTSALSSTNAKSTATPSVTILYGSQSGTSEGFAKSLAAMGDAQGYFAVSVVNLRAFKPETLPTLSYVIFVVATYGDGGPPDSARAFHKYIKGSHAKSMKHVKFTVFGLGNKNYEHYNAMGRLVDKQMDKLGGYRVFPYGEGNDRACIEDDFNTWHEGGLWGTLKSHAVGPVAAVATAAAAALPSPTSVSPAPHTTTPPRLTYDVVPATLAPSPPRVYTDETIDPSNDHFFHHTTARLVSARELRQATTSGSTLHLDFALDDPTTTTYATADNLAVLPQNDPTLVARVVAALAYDPACVVDVQPLTATTPPVRAPFPTPATIDTILTQYVDLNTAPRKRALVALAHYAAAATDQARLLYLASPDGKFEYEAWIKDACRTYGDVVEAFPSLRVPLAALLHIVPSLQPRFYTISSSPHVHPTHLHVTLGVVAVQSLPNGRRFMGVASNYLTRLANKAGAPDATIRLRIRTSAFKLPMSSATPIIMVGPGTGIAPMRAFLQERQHQRQTLGEAAVGPTWLFFGCRRQTDDYIYQDELAAYEADGTLSQLHVAFSRDTAQKVYVQHLIKQQGAALWALLAAGAHVYVCGATCVGLDVLKAFQDLVQAHGDKSVGDAAIYVEEMQASARYVQELWSSS
ncbi:Aste57867_22612 [Aphanomyces stellatus]|uniref:NADPH--hemoprotein reductase n=1 Tax=Aphanomyces stellatus TaxID=120398 RepID=A0A485LLS6_9STRA|nr:hypothetical protein As57867_022542 [Aphanomyces stellatus]VFT99269.1 Aste57867_22612 [Aphanomyces stellatus]